ncbi:MAG: amidohydrolase family protein [Nitrospinota bacterium]|jgi:predicted TIM-barrel fold metal-dependent hydrolase|nr:amidohydrolase family protein [Nitrospinota bacterium]
MPKTYLAPKSFLFLFLLSLALAAPSAAAELYFIDAHSQMDGSVDQETIIKLMNKGGVYRTILAARHGIKPRAIIQFAKAHPKRIIPSVTTKMWGYVHESKSRHKKYYRALGKQVRSGKFRSMAEVLMWHSGCPKDKCPSVLVRSGDKRVRVALKATLAKGWPFIAHIEFGSLSGSLRDDFMGDLKGMLDANPEHPFALIHMGQLEHGDARKLIKAHKNIYFLASHSNTVAFAAAAGAKEWIDMFEGEKLASAWRKLVIEYPDRFVFALDNVWGEKHWNTGNYMGQIELWRSALSDLSGEVARAIAHGNAERLWKIPPKPGASR